MSNSRNNSYSPRSLYPKTRHPQNISMPENQNNRRDLNLERTKEQNSPNQYRLQARSQEYRPELNDFTVSKYLAFILRHPNPDSRLRMNDEGYIYVKDILKERRFGGRIGLADILRIVECNDKRRFSVKCDDRGAYMIRATQGHSVELNLHLEKILHPDHFPTVVHGTTYEAWQFIRTEGLKNMNRAYIHFAIGIPREYGVISGIRNSSEICIFINLKKAMLHDLKFFLSENFVILCKGDVDGRIDPMFFSHVIDRKTNERIM